MRINDLIDALCKIRDERGEDTEVELSVSGTISYYSYDEFCVCSGDFELVMDGKTLYIEYEDK